MAKTYLEAHPANERPRVVLMDTGSTVGGTWAEERLYPGLKTNNVVGSYEFSDYPLSLDEYGLRPGQHIPGHIVHRYLRDFADHFSISPLIRFHTKVRAADLQDGGTWLVGYSQEGSAGAREGRVTARRIAVATGLTSEPHVPVFSGQEKFQGNMFHSRALRARTKVLTSSRSVVVVGGNKSAWDVCYTAARSGARVHMLVRPSGGGPSWVWRPHSLGRFSISRLSSTRFFSWFDPSPFGHLYKVVRNFLRQTWLGQRLCCLFWSTLDYFAYVSSGYHDDTFTSLRPWSSTFWMGNSLSIHNYETDWFDLVRSGLVTVHHAEIVSLDATCAQLSDGEAVEAETIVTCTGWKNTCTTNFGPPELAAKLGLPGTSGLGQETNSKDAKLMAKAEEEILQRFPELRRRPQWDVPLSRVFGTDKEQACRDTPGFPGANSLWLYHSIVPPCEDILKHRNLAFIGMHQSIHTVMVAQVQALWATAFFHDRIPTLTTQDIDQLRYEMYLETEYQMIRRPKKGGGAGGQYLDLVFDTVPYVDLLLEEVGVRTRRKSSWWRNIFEPYMIYDYARIVEEWTNPGSRSTEPS